MSVSRQLNLLGQQRVDIPHFRSLESSISNDFDLAMGTIVAGQKPLIVKGFNISMTNVIGKAASALVLNAANGVVIHYFASEAGSILSVSAAQAADILTSTNPNVSGAFVSNNTNYVGIDFLRATDPTTTDTVQFLDATSLVETAKSVPLSRALTYKIVISTNSFSSASNICPIAKVVTDINGNVTSVTDSRKMMFRLGSGGDFPNIQNTYSFPAGRSENTLTSSDVFLGGDKSIGNLKDWCDSVTTRLWEVSGGGDYWYSPTSPQNVQMIKEGAALANGDYFSYSGAGGANGDLTWQGIRILFSNAVASGVYYNIVTDQAAPLVGLTNLAIGECVYVDLTRASNATLTVTKTALTALGSPVIPGSRYIMAYRGPSGYVYARNNYLPVSSTNPFAAIPAATAIANGTVTLSATPGSTVNPLVPSINAGGLAQTNGILAIAAGPATVKGNAVATGVGTALDNVTALTAGGLIASMRSAGVEKASIDYLGNLLAPQFKAYGTSSATLLGTVASTGTAVANIIDNTISLTTVGDKILSIRTAGAEKAFFDYTGALAATSYTATGTNAVTIKSPATSGTVNIIDTTSTLSAAADKLLSIRNNASEKAYVTKTGSGSFANVGIAGQPVLGACYGVCSAFSGTANTTVTTAATYYNIQGVIGTSGTSAIGFPYFAGDITKLRWIPALPTAGQVIGIRMGWNGTFTTNTSGTVTFAPVFSTDSGTTWTICPGGAQGLTSIVAVAGTTYNITGFSICSVSNPATHFGFGVTHSVSASQVTPNLIVEASVYNTTSFVF